MRTVIVTTLLLLVPIAATAKDDGSLETMVQQQTALRDTLDIDPQDLNPRQVASLRKAQDEFFRIVAGSQSVDELDTGQRLRLVTALALIESVIHQSSDEGIDCRMGKRIGSSMNEQVCLTAAQWREREEDTRSQINRHGIDSLIQLGF